MKPVEWIRRFPWTIVACVLLLLALGVSGIARGDELSGRREYLVRQCVWIALALPASFAVTLIPYRTFKRSSYGLFAVSLLMLVVVYFLPARNGSHRWIPLGIVNFQPSEMAKIAFVLALAHYLMFRRNYRRLTGLLVPFVLTLVPVLLILREPDLGTALLFFPVLFSMLFAAGARPRHLAFVTAMGLAVSPLLWWNMSTEQKSRVTMLFSQKDEGPAPKGKGYHLHQSKRVLATGSVWGSAMTGEPVHDRWAYHLPAARTDFVFCLVGERWGLVGCGATLLVYTILFARGLWIAASTREPFGRLMCVGFVSLLAAQTIINTGMTVGLMPITGMTLPLMSYGGSSLLTTCIALGLLMNVGLRPGYEMTPEPFRFSDNS